MFFFSTSFSTLLHYCAFSNECSIMFVFEDIVEESDGEERKITRNILIFKSVQLFQLNCEKVLPDVTCCK